MVFIEIIVVVILWFLFGLEAANELVGDITYYYPISCFGPLNVYKITTWGSPYSEENDKKNSRLRIKLICGGVLSFIYMIGYFTYNKIVKTIKYINWSFNYKK